MAAKQRRQPGPDLAYWYQESLGESLCQSEQKILDQVMPTIFGYHIIQLGNLNSQLHLGSCTIPHRIILSPQPSDQAAGVSGFAKPEALPIATDSIDAVLLPHTLEFAEDPHQVLREVERVLIPEGHVVIIGFNPLSLWGVRRLIPGRNANLPWHGKFFTSVRVKDWLSLLGFDIVDTQYLFYRPPIRWGKMMQKLQFLETVGARAWPFLGAAYILVAKKRVTTLTPIRPMWRPKPRLVAVGIADPQTRSFRKVG